jgi:D-tyrosyl-tRNA(Tyr) deacylase
VGQIGHGVVLLVGIEQNDTQAHTARLADKVAGLRIFNDDSGRFGHSLLGVGGGALVVSQFTLYANCRKGRRPSFTHAADPAHARPLIDDFTQKLRELGVAPVATGEFGASMKVEIHNDGPVTLWLDSDDL